VPRLGASDGAPAKPEPGAGATLAVPEIRDYELINKELTRLLGAGVRRVVLTGVEGQRLLGFRLRGDWSATIVVEGHAGPELAAEMDAPGLTVLCLGDAADAAGRGLVAGRLVVEGDAGDGLGYAQRGGTILVRGDVGHRAGLMQAGGSIVLLGKVGRLAGERQTGGLLVAQGDRLGPHAGRGRLDGRLVQLAHGHKLPTDDLDAFEISLRSL
jgi:glutamate synthase domain-containing protein 3